MNKFTAFTSLLVLGTVGLLITAYLSPGEIHLNFADEDYQLYL